MHNRNKQSSERTEGVLREKTETRVHAEIPLYERRKGKAFHASGTWQTTKGEKILIETFGYLFFFGIFIGLILFFILPGKLASVILGIGIIGAVGTFISLFAIALHKHKQEPMEGHYYDVDYKYNAFTGKETDHTREITKDAFFGKKTDD